MRCRMRLTKLRLVLKKHKTKWLSSKHLFVTLNGNSLTSCRKPSVVLPVSQIFLLTLWVIRICMTKMAIWQNKVLLLWDCMVSTIILIWRKQINIRKKCWKSARNLRMILTIRNSLTVRMNWLTHSNKPSYLLRMKKILSRIWFRTVLINSWMLWMTWLTSILIASTVKNLYTSTERKLASSLKRLLLYRNSYLLCKVIIPKRIKRSYKNSKRIWNLHRMIWKKLSMTNTFLTRRNFLMNSSRTTRKLLMIEWIMLTYWFLMLSQVSIVIHLIFLRHYRQNLLRLDIHYLVRCRPSGRLKILHFLYTMVILLPDLQVLQLLSEMSMNVRNLWLMLLIKWLKN